MKTDGCGLLLGWDKDFRHYYCNDEDTHSLIIGGTRCGKTRCNVLPTIVLQALSGECIIAVDPKGELYGYTSALLKALDYEVICIDFKAPARSSRFNFLQPVIDAVLLDDLALAAQRARDITAMLVPVNEKSSVDPIWDDGQRAALTTAILAVCLECDDPDKQNLSNARAFLAKMCAPNADGSIPLTAYLMDLPSDSPLQAAMGIARIAPEKMRGSFYTSALATLDLFSDPNIHGMSAMTDFDYAAIGKRKRAIFLSLPDERMTYYPIAALFVYEMYQALVANADANGGRLPIRVNFDCDEFGNFVRIPDFDKFITVGGGRGIRFNLYVQDTTQIHQHYGEAAKTILSNCENWIYLQTENNDTLEELSKRLGNYTIRIPNASSSSSTSGGSYSGGYSLAGRRLLMPEEIKRIDRPWQLLTARGGRHRIMFAPDISETPFNALLGMGNPEHNQRLLMRRWDARPERQFIPAYWDIWERYIKSDHQKK